jgi:cytolysin-activating lysine-acyltransferase
MTGQDMNDRQLPSVEMPSQDRLRVYGNMLFLAFRSPRHAHMPVGVLRSYLEPAVELGQYRLFRFDEVPRGMFTWAYLNAAAEEKVITGEPLAPEDWRSGDRLWIVDLIAPYRGLMQSIGRWMMVRGNVSDTGFSFRRVAGDNQTRRIVQVDFNADRLARIVTEEDFLRKG